MDKTETLEHLANAKKAHIKWVNRAKSLIEGIPVEKDAIPLDCTECIFGQWFYSEGQKLNALPNMDCLEAIEALHFKLHDMYMQIFKIYFSDMNKSFFSKLFGGAKMNKMTDADHDKAVDYFKELQSISKELLNEIGRLERRLHAMPQSALDER